MILFDIRSNIQHYIIMCYKDKGVSLVLMTSYKHMKLILKRLTHHWRIVLEELYILRISLYM